MSSQAQQQGSDLRVQEILVLLSLHCDRYDIAQLSRYFKSHTEDEVLGEFGRAYTRLSVSDRSSLLSYSSLFSTISSASRTSIDSTTYTSGNRDQCHLSQRPDRTPQYSLIPSQNVQQHNVSSPTGRRHQDSPILGKNGQQWHPFPLQNPTSSLTSFAFQQGALQKCTACNKSYKGKDPKGELARHHRDKCEKMEFWTCQDCPLEKQSPIERRDRLRKHHLDSHTDKCQICPKGGKVIDLSTECKVTLERFKQEYPKKKAWGCPHCLACFHSLEEWRRHEQFHQTEDINCPGWSAHRMITSLLIRSRHLAVAASYYDWELCRWPEESYETVRFALERYELPAEEKARAKYASLGVEEALVQYAFEIGSSGNTFATVTHRPNALEATSLVSVICEPSQEPVIAASLPKSPKATMAQIRRIPPDQLGPDQSNDDPDDIQDVLDLYQPSSASHSTGVVHSSLEPPHMPVDVIRKNALKMFDEMMIDPNAQEMPTFSSRMAFLTQDFGHEKPHQASHSSAYPEQKRLKLQKSLQSIQKLVQRSKNSKSSVVCGPSVAQLPLSSEPADAFNASFRPRTSNINNHTHGYDNVEMYMLGNDTTQCDNERHLQEEPRPASSGGWFPDSDDDVDILDYN